MSKQLFDLSDDVAAIIGGAGALAGAVATGFAAAGARVAVLDRNAEKGEEQAAGIRAAGGQAKFYAIDALDRRSVDAARDAIEADLGPVSILFNGAGGIDPNAVVTSDRPLDQMPLEAWDRNFRLNLVGGCLLPCQSFGKTMLEHGRGSVINIASVSAHIALSKVIAYSAAKAGVVSITQFLAREWAQRGVRVNSITPGFFPGEQNRRALFEEDGSLTPRGQQVVAHTPMGRFGDPRELVGAAIFLASRASSFVTGTDLRVDGGFLSCTI